jgi:hypothetical protein
MHHAPAVNFSVGRSRFHGYLLIGLVTLGAGTLLAWCLQADDVQTRHVLAWGVWLMTSITAIVAWLRSPLVSLTWDGQIWTWTNQGESRPVDVAVLFDAQSLVLLRVQTTQSCIWVWPEQRIARSRWLAFRRAIFAPQPAANHPDVMGLLP